MSDKPKRRWFQIHLSTAIVLMFVGGGLIYLNMIRMPDAYRTNEAEVFTLFESETELMVRLSRSFRPDPFIKYGFPIWYQTVNEWGGSVTYLKRIVFNGTSCLAMFIACGCIFEWIRRRREARKP